MAWIEELTEINQRFYATQRRARRHPRANGGTSWGKRRDGLDARASRERRERLAKVGVKSW